MALWRQMLKLFCETYQRKKERKEKKKQQRLIIYLSKQSIQDQVHYGINFTLKTDEVNEWHSALKELQPHSQAKNMQKKP